jgi:hypothetical protein
VLCPCVRGASTIRSQAESREAPCSVFQEVDKRKESPSRHGTNLHAIRLLFAYGLPLAFVGHSGEAFGRTPGYFRIFGLPTPGWKPPALPSLTSQRGLSFLFRRNLWDSGCPIGRGWKAPR